MYCTRNKHITTEPVINKWKDKPEEQGGRPRDSVFSVTLLKGVLWQDKY